MDNRRLEDDRITEILVLQREHSRMMVGVNRKLDEHGKNIAVIEHRTQVLEPVVKDLQETKQRGIGAMTALATVAGFIGAGVTYLIDFMSRHPPPH